MVDFVNDFPLQTMTSILIFNEFESVQSKVLELAKINFAFLLVETQSLALFN